MQTPPSPAPLTLSARASESHKGDYGRVLVVGGSRGMAGSIGLTASAALRTGAGLVTALVPSICLETVAGFNPCVMTFPAADDGTAFAADATESLQDLPLQPDAMAIGPGMRTGRGACAIIEWALGQPVPRVIDADGLNVLAESGQWSQRMEGPVVLTPHPGEWQRMCGVSAADRESQCQAARSIALESGVVVLLKGARTLVTDGKRDYFNSTGNPGMATAGCGDCLTGIVTALLAGGLGPWEAAALGAWMHGRAGDLAAAQRGTAGLIATDLLEHLPRAIEDATEKTREENKTAR